MEYILKELRNSKLKNVVKMEKATKAKIKKYYKERGDVVDAVQSRRGKGLHLGKKVILILGYIFRNHSNFAH